MMTDRIVDWNPLVNSNFSLDGEFGLEDGFVEELAFDSGKKRTWLRNSYVPKEYPNLTLDLDSRDPIGSFDGKSEYEEFEDWFNISLRYGSLPFSITKLGFIERWNTKKAPIGIYKFIPNSLTYEKGEGVRTAKFGLIEISYSPEIRHTFLSTNDGKVLLNNYGHFIVTN